MTPGPPHRAPTLTALSRSAAVAALALLAAGCVRRIPVERAELPALAGYHERQQAVLVRGNEVITIEPRHEPELTLRLARSCSVWERLRERCDRTVQVPLARLRLTGTTLRVDARTSKLLDRSRPVVADLSEVEGASLELAADVDDWRPRGAIGMSFAGPIGIVGWSGHWYPVDAVAVELGLLPAADLGVVHAGVRVRPVRLARRVLPFVGAFLHGGAAFDPASERSERWAATGARLGLDLELGRARRWLLGAEIDLVRPLGDDPSFVGDLRGRWLGWGGGHLAYQF